MGSRIRYLHLPGNHFTGSVSAKLYVLRYSMLVPLSSVSLSHSTRPKFIVLFPCIARAESVIATILYCNTVYTAVDCFAVYYCSIYIFLEWRNIFESCLLQIQLQIQQACPAQNSLAFNRIVEKRCLGLIFRANMRCTVCCHVVETKDNLALHRHK